MSVRVGGRNRPLSVVQWSQPRALLTTCFPWASSFAVITGPQSFCREASHGQAESSRSLSSSSKSKARALCVAVGSGECRECTLCQHHAMWDSGSHRGTGHDHAHTQGPCSSLCLKPLPPRPPLLPMLLPEQSTKYQGFKTAGALSCGSEGEEA